MSASKKRNTSLQNFCRALKQHRHFYLSCHVSPEGDAIGSLLAMESLLRRLGKKTTVVGQDAFPKRLLLSLDSRKWKRVSEVAKSRMPVEAVVLTDSPNIDRIGRVSRLIGPDTVIFNIDHHISNEYYGHYNYVLPEAGATAEVVFHIFKHLKMRLTRDEAKHLYVGLSTDTGSFKYSNTNAESHLIAAQLIKAGKLDIESLNDRLYSNYSLSRMSLYSRLLARVKTAHKGSIAWVGVRQKDLDETGANYEDTEGFIDFLRYMKEVKLVFFMTELPQTGEVRVSFRAKDRYDVNKIATFFDGGGHTKAAGCRMKGSLGNVEKQILKRMKKVIR